MEVQQKRQIDEMQKFDLDSLQTYSEDEKLLIIERLQARARNYGEEITRKQQRVDELIRESNRVRTKYKNFKCPLCLNGERIPPKL
mmetsp:Transcript_31633/g.48385  ORF Transcript_31633/g.48385 Transcript_31633/m.48385 type:complete len:86 (+) Transcript_31633:899-1156(+)